MIPANLISRLVKAHDNAVRAAENWTEATPGTRTSDRLGAMYDRAEHRFDSALSDVIEAAKRK